MAEIGGLVKTKYIKFNFHDNDYCLSAVETLKRTFAHYLFSINFRGFGVDKDTFEERWEIFEDFIAGRYGGNAKGFANHIADMIALDSFTYNIIYNNFDCYDDMLDKIRSLFDNGNCNYLKCNISFVNEIDTEEDWNSETIYLDMATGYIEVR